ncbi:centromere protein H (CENP-H)-domain-containing protein [Sphaerosporella brunnea]|uniref:Centromere protein H (CENP-H)-domain-containing protein n=1 Tax=Sphaerosporella brunnea TaxID=1250544 RepID=A0A5J5FBG5_9PEZI|nr:centromere protein H (CENP-H)-domain-containing protein [Sphaerosporella brunnea]
MDTLQNTCLSLLLATQSHVVGFPHLTPSSANDSLESVLNDKERQLLELYDKLSRVKLERRILEAELAATREAGEPTTEPPKETDLIAARADRILLETATASIISAFPVIHTVHPDYQSPAPPPALTAMIKRRDDMAQTHANLSNAVALANEELLSVLQAVEKVKGENKSLTEQLLELVKERGTQVDRGEVWTKTKEELDKALASWEVARNVASAVIVGSGVDWVRDKELRELVLACGDD